MGEDGHGEPAIEKLLAESRRDREREIGKQFHRGLRQDPFRNGLNRAARFGENSPHAPQVQPLMSGNGRGADKRGEKNPGSVMDRHTMLGGRKSVGPGTPRHYGDGKPLKGDGRGVKSKP